MDKANIVMLHMAKKLYFSISSFGINSIAENIADLLYCNILISFRVKC